MPVVDPAMMSSEERPVGLRTRKDLIIQESIFQGEYCWVVKDPVAMKYFRLRKPEFMVLERLAEPTSYQELKDMLTHSFPESTTRLQSVQQLVVSLHKSGLLVSNSGGQAMPLQKRRNKELKQKTLGLLSSLVSLRFPGWDPERFLNWLHPKCKFFFQKWFCAIVFFTCLAAAILVLSNYHTFMAKLPEFQQFFNFDNLLFMGAILIFTKSVHELGHGLLCKHFGGECHQIGFMLLVMTPAMYCDTSDSWILKNRWHRMAIGAGGMYVELFMAAICTFIWWFTHPGWLHYLSLNIMFLSSVSTIVFNANPLLRYDGYYILSDYLEIPNLSQKSKLALISKLRVWCLGMKPVNSRMLPKRKQLIFAIYSVASFVYRWFVMIVIFWFISEIFEPYGLIALGHIMIGISLFGMVVVPLYKMVKFFIYPGRLREVKKTRFYGTLTLLVTTILFVCYFPLPHYVWATFVVRPQNAQMLVLTHEGHLEEVHAMEGGRIELGDKIAVLRNVELELELEELNGTLAQLQSTLIELESLGQVDTNFNVAGRFAETEAQILSIENQILVKQQQAKQLAILATRSGELFAPPNVPEKSLSDLMLGGWTDTPLDERNLGTLLEANTVIGMIGDPQKMEAILVVDQSDVQLLKPGQKVIALLQQYRNQFVETELNFVSQDELTVVPRELSQTNKGPVAVAPDPSGVEKPILKSFEAHAKFSSEELASKEMKLLPGMHGHAKIHVGSASLGQRLFRYLSTIINFR